MFESNDDYALALRLQQQFDNEELDSAAVAALDQPWDSGPSSEFMPADSRNDKKPADLDTSTMTLVDPRWEMIDPIPDIRALFIEFNDKYFWGRLASVEVRWSPRMTLCAGLCVYEGRGGMCSVRLSEPLLKLRPRKDLIETLLHEMIHAYLFVTDNNKDHDGHGPEFHKHMYRLNKETGTNISVYHTFHDEVDNYRQHWWRCDGPCQKKTPYFGYVKRAMNRAPSHRDTWWSEHQRSCGGTYTKIKEPEGYGVKKKGGKEEKKIEKQKGTQDIRTFTDPSKKGRVTGKPSSTITRPGASADPNDVPTKPVIVNGILTSSTSKPKIPEPDEKFAKPDKPGLFGTGVVKAKVQGFGETKNDQMETIKSREDGPNIHGFGSIYPGQSNDKKNSGNVVQVQKGFSGGSHTLGGGSQNTGNRDELKGPIVRRIPGIGLITSERISHNPSAASTNEATENDEVPITSKSETEHSKIDDFLHKDESDGSQTRPQAVIDYNSDESDFDDFLDVLLKPTFKKEKKKSVGSTSSQADKRVPGFTSVSNKSRHSDPKRRYPDGPQLPKADRSRKSDEFLRSGSNKSDKITSPDFKVKTREESSGNSNTNSTRDKPPVISKEYSNDQNYPDQVPNERIGDMLIDGQMPTDRMQTNDHQGAGYNDKTTPDNSSRQKSADLGKPEFGNFIPSKTKPSAKRKMPTDFAVDRNKRVLNGLSSDSESDLDENMTLGSVMNRKKEKSDESHMKRIKLSGTSNNSDMNIKMTGENVTSKVGPTATQSLHSSNYVNLTTSESKPSGNIANVNTISREQNVVMINCPVCRAEVQELLINEHLDTCLLSADF